MSDQSCNLNKSKPGLCRCIAGTYLVICIALAALSGIFLLPELDWRADANKSETHQKARLLHAEKADLEQRLAEMVQERETLSASDPDGSGAQETETDTKRNEDIQAAIEQLDGGIVALSTRLGQVDGDIRAFNVNADTRAVYYEMGDDRWRERAGWMSDYRENQLQQMLVLLMGLVGGFVSLARSFVLTDRPDPSPSAYFIRPVFGCVMAAIVYLAIKAGQFTLSTSSADKPLNSYTIALIAFVSGLMGQHALGAIERWGAGLFARFGYGASASELQQSLASLRTRLEEAKKRIPTEGADARANAAAEEAARAIQRVGNGSDRELVALANSALARLQALVEELERAAVAAPR